MSKNYENMSNEEIKEQLEWSDHHEFSYNYAIWAFEEIDRLNNIIETMLEFNFFKEECPLNFGFGDEKEEKAQDVFYEDDYCEENCNDIYKKCWLKYFEKLQELKEDK